MATIYDTCNSWFSIFLCSKSAASGDLEQQIHIMSDEIMTEWYSTTLQRILFRVQAQSDDFRSRDEKFMCEMD